MKGKESGPAGSPSAGEPVFLEIGKFRRPHGVYGDIIVELNPRFSATLEPDREVYIGNTHFPLLVSRVRNHKEGLLLGFEGYETPEKVGKFRNQAVFIRGEKKDFISTGEYYHDEIIGLIVEDETGNALGKIIQIMVTGANDVYVVKDSSGNEILLPAIPDVIKRIDLAKTKMIVHLLPGLIGAE